MFNNPQFYPDWYLAADGRTYSATLDSEFKEIINVLLLVHGYTNQGGRSFKNKTKEVEKSDLTGLIETLGGKPVRS